MDEKTQILKNQIQKLPPKLKAYLNNGLWTEEVKTIALRFNLEEYQKISIENEVLLIIVGLESYADLKENIIKEAEINPNIAESIVEEISENILDQIDILEPIEPPPQNNIGNDFEQIILNQARAMQPAQAPSNLPVEGNPQPAASNQEEKPKAIHNYMSDDPYRESIQ